MINSFILLFYIIIVIKKVSVMHTVCLLPLKIRRRKSFWTDSGNATHFRIV